MNLGLDGRCALVLAATRGLGRAAARALAAEGARVAITGSDLSRAEAAAAEIAAETGATVVGVAGDMMAEGIEAVVDQVEAALGPVEILVLNHPGPALGVAAEIDLDGLPTQFRMIVSNPIALVRRTMPAMREKGFGRILATSGGSLVNPLPNKVMDNTLRPAIAGYLKALSNEIAADGVTVNIIIPGTFVTERVHASTKANAGLDGITVEEAMRRRLAGIPAGRFGELDAEFGATVAFLCGAGASYINGSIVRCDGGQVRSL
ncbi:SDR family oxidoreductase [Acuticoccus mangrovi]|uniref:SDR family oxidoreductase n=1 Tax=Acuticoccus mangrovi TaxID=2796142 RepID=A0A934IV06_9HYPH|nr:SDR family oxidoreductase [Acuticoccus mangrovi]MBJ3778530.1 SDR family oxidoreductase [Acuticoccus mangrovi]